MKQMLLVASLAVAVAVAVLATLLVVTSSQGVLAQGTRGQEGPRSVPKTANPPDALLMKGPIVLQKGRELSRCWDYYPKEKGSTVWWSVCEDTLFLVPRRYVPLPRRLGETGLHIRINNSQRLQRLWFQAYTGYSRKAYAPIGKGRRLDYTIRRVERGGKPVAWDVFFRLPPPESHYYLSLGAKWKLAPKTGIVFHDTWYSFHVRTF